MRNRQISLLGIGLGWAVTISVVLAVPLISIDAVDRSQFFWIRVLWSAFLATLVWSIGGAFMLRSTADEIENGRTGGVLPALGFVVIVYAVASFIAMILFMLISSGDTPSKVHLVIQVCLAGTAGVFFAILSLARSSASIDPSRFPPEIPPPSVLVSHIENQEQQFIDMGTSGAPIATELKQLRETVTYSLSRVGRIASRGSYQTFSTKVLDLCGVLSSSDTVEEESIRKWIDTIRTLQREARSIADGLKR